MLKQYLELTKPERTLANVITAAAGFLFASKWHIDWVLFLSTLVGLSLLVASACALNNVIDRELDAKMPRTKKRALVAGTVSQTSGLVFAIILGITGLLILWFYVNTLVAVLGAIAYFDYIVLYGYSKRHSKYSTWIGTVCGALPMVAGYCAVTGAIDAGAVILYLSMTFWQMAHFYSIAIYRLKDYKSGNIPIWPAVEGIGATKIQIIIYIVAFLAASVGLSVFGKAGFIYAIILILVNVAWLRKGLAGWKNKDEAKWARGMFMYSLKVLLIFAAALSVGSVLP